MDDGWITQGLSYGRVVVGGGTSNHGGAPWVEELSPEYLLNSLIHPSLPSLCHSAFSCVFSDVCDICMSGMSVKLFKFVVKLLISCYYLNSCF